MLGDTQILELLELEENVHDKVLSNQIEYKKAIRMLEWMSKADQTPKSIDELSCGFCFKKRNEVELLIAGPNICICKDCVNICNDIILLRSNDNGLH